MKYNIRLWSSIPPSVPGFYWSCAPDGLYEIKQIENIDPDFKFDYSAFSWDICDSHPLELMLKCLKCRTFSVQSDIISTGPCNSWHVTEFNVSPALQKDRTWYPVPVSPPWSKASVSATDLVSLATVKHTLYRMPVQTIKSLWKNPFEPPGNCWEFVFRHPTRKIDLPEIRTIEDFMAIDVTRKIKGIGSALTQRIAADQAEILSIIHGSG